MSGIIEFTIDENAFTLGRVFADPPDATVELERIVPTEPGPIPFLWIHTEGLDELERNIRANEAVDDLIALDRLSEGTLYRVTLTTDNHGLL